MILSDALSKFGTVAAAAVLLVVLAGCGNDEPAPAERLQEGLDQASDAIEDMEEKGEKLSTQRDKLQAELEVAATKHVAMLNAQLSYFREKLTELPAEQEQAFSQRLQQLETDSGQVKTALESYVSQESKSGWDAVQQQIDALKEQFDTFDRDLTDALKTQA